MGLENAPHTRVSSRRVIPPGEYDRREISPVAKLLWTSSLFINVACTLFTVDGLSHLEPQYWALTTGRHVTPYNNHSGHVTSLTNHSSPYDRLPVLGSDYDQTFPTAYIADEIFTSAWNDRLVRQQPTDTFQPTECQPTARQLPVCFNDVISTSQRTAFYGSGSEVYPTAANCITCPPQYGRNSVSGSLASSFGTYQMTCNSSKLTVYPPQSPPWCGGQQLPHYRACAEYRMSRHHVVSDVTASQRGWAGVRDFDDTMCQGKFVNPLEGV